MSENTTPFDVDKTRKQGNGSVGVFAVSLLAGCCAVALMEFFKPVRPMSVTVDDGVGQTTVEVTP